MAAETTLTGALSFEASTDLSAGRFHFVVVDSSKELALAGAGVSADGVLQDQPDAQGKIGSVMPLNGSILKVTAGAAVAVGAEVMSNASGRAITGTATNKSLGKAVSAAGADGEIIEVLANHRGTL